MSNEIRDLMVPLAGYATVARGATLREAVTALEDARRRYDRSGYKLRAILVLDDAGDVVGKLSQMDVIRAIEPDLARSLDTDSLNRFGIRDGILEATLDQHHVWEKPLEQLCAEAADQLVEDVMYTPEDDERIDVDDSLPDAIRRLMLGRRQALLVHEGEHVVGVLRLTDIFAAVGSAMRGSKEG